MPIFQINLLPAVLPIASLPLGKICHKMLKGHSFFNPERLLSQSSLNAIFQQAFPHRRKYPTPFPRPDSRPVKPINSHCF